MAGTSHRLTPHPAAMHQPSGVRLAVPAAMDPPPAPPAPQLVCVQADALARIEEKVDGINDRIAEGNTQFATLHLRVRALEVVLYGGCAIALIYLINKVLEHKAV